MKKTNRIFFILIITFLLVSIFNEVLAINPDAYKPGDVTVAESSTIIVKFRIILGAIRNISIVVAVISLMLIGFKYIIGSVEEKANYKKTLLPYVIGVVIAASGTTIVSFIYNAVH